MFYKAIVVSFGLSVFGYSDVLRLVRLFIASGYLAGLVLSFSVCIIRWMCSFSGAQHRGCW